MTNWISRNNVDTPNEEENFPPPLDDGIKKKKQGGQPGQPGHPRHTKPPVELSDAYETIRRKA
jgi:hypothetical protein